MKSRKMSFILLFIILIFQNTVFIFYPYCAALSNYYRPIDDGCILPFDPSTSEPLVLDNNTVYLKKIEYQVMFNYPEAIIKANYTLKNVNDSEQQLNVLFPFGMDQNIKISSLTTESTNIEYSWNYNFNISLLNRIINVITIQMELNFDPFEEKLIHIEYSLKYGILENDMGRFYYGYVYCLETSNFWNTPIESVIFEAWVPKNYAEVSPFVFSQVTITHNREMDKYNIHWFEEENWLPLGNLEMEYVTEQNHISVLLYPLLIFGFLFLFIITVLGLIIFSKKVKNLK